MGNGAAHSLLNHTLMTQSPRSVAELDFKPLQDVFPSPRDWRDHVIYQLLIDRFDDPSTPYTPVPDPHRAPRYSDYAHLERLAEAQAEIGQAEAGGMG